MSTDQEPLRVRDRVAVAQERVEQAPPSQNGQRPKAKVSTRELGPLEERGRRGQGVGNAVAPRHAASNGIGPPETRVSEYASTNGTRPTGPRGPKHASTNGVGPAHAASNEAVLERTFVAYDLDWDSYLPSRSSGLAWRVGQRVKRVLDAVLAFGMVLALLPLFIAVALMVRLTSRGPCLYVCEYVGTRGRRFMGYKFRTMVADAEAKKAELLHLNHMKGPAFKIRRDPRITPLGRILRKFSIDELPQLWNVVKGDMSLVGPRPPLPEEWIDFQDWQRAKLAVIPGITCSWQVSGRSDIVDFDEWARLDLEYIERWSLWEDSKLLVRTIPAVLKGHGAY